MKQFNDDKGYALAAALGAIALVTIIAMTSYALAQRSVDQAGTESFSNRAYQVAASALEYETSRFENGATLVSANGQTLPQGGTFDFTFTTSGEGRVMLKCTATLGGKTESVSVEYLSLDLADTVYSGSGSAGMFGGSYFNSPDSMIIGPLYLKLNTGETINPNSSMSFIDGPLYIENGSISAKGGVSWIHTSKVSSYNVYTDNDPSGLPTGVNVYPLGAKITAPTITDAFETSLKSLAQAAGQYYEGTTHIGGTGAKFPADSNGVLNASGTIFVKGRAIVDAAVTGYKGQFTIYATDGITVNGRLLPADFVSSGGTQSGTYDSYYQSESAVTLPQVHDGYCATLISRGPINSTWSAGNSNGSSEDFAFCGAMFTGSSIVFQSSLRGSIIAGGSLGPGKKIILATQNNLRQYLPDAVKELFTRVLARENWVRGN